MTAQKRTNIRGGGTADPRKDTIERPSRAQETRDSEDIHEEWGSDWNPDKGMRDTSAYPAREGFTQRWVRTMLGAREDSSNVMRQMNRGWRPRKADTVPKGSYAPTFDFRGESVVGIEGMILMERPLRIHEKHAEHNREMKQRQESAVEQNLMQSHEPHNRGFGKPRIEAESEVSTGSRPAPVADD